MLLRFMIDSQSTHKLSCMHANHFSLSLSSAFLKSLVPCSTVLTSNDNFLEILKSSKKL